jgi:ribosomal protein L27
MAHKKGVGSSKNGRESASQRLGALLNTRMVNLFQNLTGPR